MKNLFRNIIFILILTATLTDFSGFSYGDELESSLLISAMSIGYGEEGYNLSFIFIDHPPEKSGKNEYKILTVSSPTIGGCIEKARKNSRENILFGQTDAVFIEKDILMDEKVYSEITDFLERDPYIGYSIYIFATEEKIDSFNKMISSSDEKMTEFLDNIIIKDPAPNLLRTRLADISSSFKAYTIPMISTGEEISVSNLVAMDERRFRTVLPENLFKSIALLTSAPGRHYYETSLGEFYTEDYRSRAVYRNGVFEITITGKFSTLTLSHYNSLQGKMIEPSEEEFEGKVKQDCEKAIKILSAQNADIIGLEEYMHRFHNSEYGYFTQNGISPIRDCGIVINVDFEFRNNGVMY